MSKHRIGVRTVLEGWIKVISTKIVALGNPFERKIESHGNAVAVLPYAPDRHVAIIISQFSGACGISFSDSIHVVEAVAGINHEGNVQDAARRGAMEEAGARLQVLKNVTR